MLFRDRNGSFWGRKGIASLEVPRDDTPSITCPRCGRTSYNPTDIREGYCGNCHDWTRSDR